MSQRPQAYDNLINAGDLKPAMINRISIKQYIDTAEGLLRDAKVESNSPHGRYILAYEGVFSVVMATLEHFGARPGDGEGHRIIAIQRAIADLGMDGKEYSSVMTIHSDRNRATYRSPIPPMTKEQAEIAIAMLDSMMGKARALLSTELAPPSAGPKP